jgi:deferrochelatase/peroxidase EfeB
VIAPPELPDRADVQGLVAYGYNSNRCHHFVLEVVDATKARGFIDELLKAGRITSAASDDNAGQGREDAARRKGRADCAMNIGFSYRGLEKLGVPLPYLRVFQMNARAFVQGAYLRAARYLADTGNSAAPWWDPRFSPGHADVLLSLYADEAAELVTSTAELTAKSDGAFKGWCAPFKGCHLRPDPKKRVLHFGLRDGISNPAIKGFHVREERAESPYLRPHSPGEFILGYANDEGFNPWLLVAPGPRPDPRLLPCAHIHPEFFRNGSFGAFRVIEQDEKRFSAFITHWAERELVSEEYVRAKLTGRWDDGRRVRPVTADTPEGKDPEFSEDNINDFDFSDDPDALGCPFGAHIRRMNPRADPIAPSRRRPLLRRGVPYGPPYYEDPRAQRGLLGLFFCASLEDQFEHLLAQWGNANPMGPDNRGNSKDPLIGHHEDPMSVFDIPMPDIWLRQLNGFSPFVTTRGTLYAYYPGLAALAWVARIGNAHCNET